MLEQRGYEDDCTLGEKFFFFTNALGSVAFGESFRIITTALTESGCASSQSTEEQSSLLIEMYSGCLPEYICNSLVKVA